LQRLEPKVRVEWFHQSGNKEARILSNSATVLHTIRMPRDWAQRWPEFYAHLTTFRRLFKSNRHDDAADVLTGIVEREVTPASNGKWQRARFI
jgi:predicted phage terminase large subunit-like protein